MSEIREWEEVNRERLFEKYRVIDRVDFKTPSGTVADFYIKAEHGSAAVVALTKDSQVVLARQFRPGPAKILDELPGGNIDEGEEPIDAARRELFEETGFTGDFELVGTCLDDAYSTMERHCFVARNCIKAGDPQNSEVEITEVVLKSVDEFRRQLRSGQMTDVEIGYIALDYLGKL